MREKEILGGKSPKSDNIRWSSLSMIPLVCTPYLSDVTSFLKRNKTTEQVSYVPLMVPNG